MTASPEYRYTVEGELLTRAEIVERVLRDHPKLRADTVRKRIDGGARTWKQLGQKPAAGMTQRRLQIKNEISRAFRKSR